MPTTLINGMYEELLYNLDLCILAYHLYHQTLIWPMDPFYEQQAYKFTQCRINFMNSVRPGPAALGNPTVSHYKGPQNFLNPPWRANDTLDPIITDYTRLNPWKPSIFLSTSLSKTNQWLYIQPSRFITDKIATVSMCQSMVPSYDQPPYQFNLIRPRPSALPSTGTNQLYCFEGGTGGIAGTEQTGEPTSHALSMMGFVLVRIWGTDDEYDVHIAFRGSRSGWVPRAYAGGKFSGGGNPDWVTDMAWKANNNSDPVFSPHGKSSNGFTQSMKSILPLLLACLDKISSTKTRPPRAIYVTGHSLGGALAALCAGALAIRNSWPASLQNWPWNNLRLITFSAPIVGDEDFCSAVNSQTLARRVYVQGDVVTGSTSGYEHIGAKVELQNLGGEPHDFSTVRQRLIMFLQPQGANRLPDPDTTIIEKYPNINALYLAQGFPFNSDCLPDFAQHLKEYLTVLRNIICMPSSHALWSLPTDIDARTEKISTLITAISRNQVTVANIGDFWPLNWSGDPYMDKLLGLCLALLLLSKGAEFPALPEALNNLLRNI